MSKQALRQWVWDELTRTAEAAFPRPVHGRIPNFRGSSRAAERLFDTPEYQRASVLKVGPDAPLHPVRTRALRDGKIVYIPPPRLAGRFIELDPARIPAGRERAAASLAHAREYGREVPLPQIRPVSLIVSGSVAVARDGARAGKGEGYSELEYAALRALGHPDMPVATVVHPIQIVASVPWEEHDLSVDIIATPDELIRTHRRYPQPSAIDWERLGERLQHMSALAEVRFTIDGVREAGGPAGTGAL
ncbi:MAG TPA: 5-formyltetrahydrofolate cyclo-ligase [Limnochordia bacterium]